MADPGVIEHAEKLAEVSERVTQVFSDAFGDARHWNDEVVVLGMLLGYVIGNIETEDREKAIKEVLKIAAHGTETLDEIRRHDDHRVVKH